MGPADGTGGALTWGFARLLPQKPREGGCHGGWEGTLLRLSGQLWLGGWQDVAGDAGLESSGFGLPSRKALEPELHSSLFSG